MSDIIFHTLNHPHSHFIQSLHTALSKHNASVAADSKLHPIAVCATDKNELTLGAIYGWLQWGWLFIDSLWVEESARHQGIGSQLLQQLEQLALKRGINRAYLDTANFQAPSFYNKHGYEIFSEMDVTADDGKDYIKYSMRKPSIDYTTLHTNY